MLGEFKRKNVQITFQFDFIDLQSVVDLCRFAEKSYLSKPSSDNLNSVVNLENDMV